MSARGMPASRAAAAWNVERVTEKGVVVGWAYDPETPGPASIAVLLKGVVAAEALATLFRADLLAAGHGHGHYGFAARLRMPLGEGQVALSVLLNGQPVGEAKRVAVPKQQPALPCPVEALLAPPASWTVADVLARPGCLPWAAHLARLGAVRFIEAAYRFVLARWPSAPEISVHERGLLQGVMTAEALLVRLLGSRERADMPPTLIPPFHPDFLFGPSAAASGLFPHTR